MQNNNYETLQFLCFKIDRLVLNCTLTKIISKGIMHPLLDYAETFVPASLQGRVH